jgi:hypothetical protein
MRVTKVQEAEKSIDGSERRSEGFGDGRLRRLGFASKYDGGGGGEGDGKRRKETCWG